MLTSLAWAARDSQRSSASAGEVGDLPDATAEAYIEHGQAEAAPADAAVDFTLPSEPPEPDPHSLQAVSARLATSEPNTDLTEIDPATGKKVRQPRRRGRGSRSSDEAESEGAGSSDEAKPEAG